MDCKLAKKPAGMKAAAKAKAGAAPPVAFQLTDNGDLTFTVHGVDAAGAVVDISAVATLQASSDNPAVVTVDPPVGMSSAVHAAVPAPAVGATANVLLTATFNDGSVGPFTITWVQNIVAGGVTGIEVSPGAISVH